MIRWEYHGLSDVLTISHIHTICHACGLVDLIFGQVEDTYVRIVLSFSNLLYVSQHCLFLPQSNDIIVEFRGVGLAQNKKVAWVVAVGVTNT